MMERIPGSARIWDKLTRRLYQALPAGAYLASTGFDRSGAPAFAGTVPAAAGRDAQWRSIVAAGAAQRNCAVFADAAEHREFRARFGEPPAERTVHLPARLAARWFSRAEGTLYLALPDRCPIEPDGLQWAFDPAWGTLTIRLPRTAPSDPVPLRYTLFVLEPAIRAALAAAPSLGVNCRAPAGARLTVEVANPGRRPLTWEETIAFGSVDELLELKAHLDRRVAECSGAPQSQTYREYEDLFVRCVRALDRRSHRPVNRLRHWPAGGSPPA